MTSDTREHPLVGSLVVIPTEPMLGVGRLERILAPEAGEPERGRVLLYDEGRFVVRPMSAVRPCPPGVWDRHASPPTDPSTHTPG